VAGESGLDGLLINNMREGVVGISVIRLEQLVFNADLRRGS